MSEEMGVALVTGGSRGIGRAVCVALAESGYQVVVNYRSGEDAAAETVKLCQAGGGNALAVQFDTSDSEAVKKGMDQIKENFGRLDVLVNNAGISKDGLFLRFKDQDWHDTIRVNLDGAFYVARAASKMLMRSPHGSIINMSSVVGQMGNAGQSAYVASKAGLIGFTKSLAKELAPRAITVNAIAPGFIETDMTASLDPAHQAEMLKAIPLERYGKAEEVASLVAFLAGPNARYITGQVIGINGGMYM